MAGSGGGTEEAVGGGHTSATADRKKGTDAAFNVEQDFDGFRCAFHDLLRQTTAFGAGGNTGWTSTLRQPPTTPPGSPLAPCVSTGLRMRTKGTDREHRGWGSCTEGLRACTVQRGSLCPSSAEPLSRQTGLFQLPRHARPNPSTSEPRLVHEQMMATCPTRQELCASGADPLLRFPQNAASNVP